MYPVAEHQKSTYFLSLRVFGLLSSFLLLFPCGNSNKDEDNSPKTLNDKNY